MSKPFTIYTTTAATRRAVLGLSLLPAPMLAGCATAISDDNAHNYSCYAVMSAANDSDWRIYA